MSGRTWRAPFGHPHDVAVVVDPIHEPGGGGDPVGRGFAVEVTVTSSSVSLMPKVIDRGPAGRDGAAAYLAQRGRHPDLILAVQGQAGRQPRPSWRAAKTPDSPGRRGG